MEWIVYIVLFVVSLLLAGVCFKIVRSTQNKAQQLATEKVEIQTAAALDKQQINTLQQQLEQATAEKITLAEQLENIQRRQIQDQERLRAEQDKLVELKQQFEQQKAELKNEFKVVSAEIVNQRQKELSEHNTQSVGALLNPLKEQIDRFQKRVNEVHSETLQGNTSLGVEIKKIMEVGLTMRDEASNLASALKGSSQQRGAWGEAQLERTLQMSGLYEEHYEKQSSFTDIDGKRKQTDYLIMLPDNKHIIIDSKVSLIAYDKAVVAETEEQRRAAMDEHVVSIKRHIDDLAGKDYANLIGIHSPSFVLMFLPIEPAYIEALKHNKDLFGYGYDKNIVLVSHTTLIPILRTVANLWVLENSNNEAREIGEKAGDIYNSVCTVAERLDKLGNSLKTASTHYNDTVKAIAGRQGLQGKVERFTELSSKANKTMPALSSRHIDYDTSKLDIQPLSIEAKDDPEKNTREVD